MVLAMSAVDGAPGYGSGGTRPWWRRVAGLVGLVAAWTLAVVWLAWAAGALWFDLPPSWPSGVLAIAYLVATAAAAALVGRRRLLVVLACCALVNAGWLLQAPSNDRDWQPNVAVQAHAERDGDVVTLYGVRNTDYRTEHDYTVRRKTRVVRLSQLQGVDLFLCYWGSPWIAHPFVSFRFADAEPICFSIETRMERGESYSTFGGLYRRYELTYSVGEERDFVGLRAIWRQGEDVYLYRLRVGPERARELFVEYCEACNELRQHPRFYNVLTNNCTSNIRTHMVATAERPRPWDWRILMSGKLDELLHERGGLVSELPIEQLKPRCLVDDAARRHVDAPDFSQRIRQGVPGF